MVRIVSKIRTIGKNWCIEVRPWGSFILGGRRDEKLRMVGVNSRVVISKVESWGPL